MRKGKIDPNKRTVFSNVFEGKVKKERKYYAFIDVDKSTYVEQFEGITRTGAIRHFNKVAKMNNGYFDGKVFVYR